MYTPETQSTEAVTTTESYYTSLNRVTRLSKYLAMVLFVVLPFVGAYVGYEFAGSTEDLNIEAIPNHEVIPVKESTSRQEVAELDLYWEFKQFFKMNISSGTTLTGALRLIETGEADGARVDTEIANVRIDTQNNRLYANRIDEPLLTVHEYSSTSTIEEFIASLIPPRETSSDSCTVDKPSSEDGTTIYGFFGTHGDVTCPSRAQFVLLENYVVGIWYRPGDFGLVFIDPASLSIKKDERQ